MRGLLLSLVLTVSAFAQAPFFFIQTTDPQFGMFAEDKNFTQETANWEFVIANANRLKPAFIVVCGDLTNKAGNADEIAEYKRINTKLSPAIHLYSVPGNHDAGNEPTAATLAAYRSNYGRDYYAFDEGPIHGIVLNSTLMKAPAGVAADAAA